MSDSLVRSSDLTDPGNTFESSSDLRPDTTHGHGSTAVQGVRFQGLRSTMLSHSPSRGQLVSGAHDEKTESGGMLEADYNLNHRDHGLGWRRGRRRKVRTNFGRDLWGEK